MTVALFLVDDCYGSWTGSGTTTAPAGDCKRRRPHRISPDTDGPILSPTPFAEDARRGWVPGKVPHRLCSSKLFKSCGSRTVSSASARPGHGPKVQRAPQMQARHRSKIARLPNSWVEVRYIIFVADPRRRELHASLGPAEPAGPFGFGSWRTVTGSPQSSGAVIVAT